MRLFHLVDQFLKLFDRDFFFGDERRDGIDIRAAEVAADDRCKRALVILLVADHSIILVGRADALVADEAFLFERAHHGGERVDVRTGVVIECDHLLDELRTMLPENVHGLFLFGGEFLFHIARLFDLTMQMN